MFSQRKAWIMKAQERFAPDAQVLAGQHGEELAAASLREALKDRQTPARLYPSLRIPKPQGHGKFEVDLVLLHHDGLMLIEVKHWSGQLTPIGNTWRHSNGHHSREWENPLLLLQEKAEALRIWLRTRGIALESKAINSFLLLSHSQIRCEGHLQHDPHILRLNEFQTYLRTHIAARSPSSSKLAFPFDAVKAQIKHLPTWDSVTLHGGQVWRGDLHSLILKSKGQQHALDRLHFQSAQVRCPRALFSSFYRSPKLLISDWQGERRSQAFDLDSRLIFQISGQATRTEIQLMHLEELQLGWRDLTYYKIK